MPTSAFSRMCSKFSLALILVGLAAVVSPAVAQATTYQGWFDYARNGSNINGTLTWKWTQNYTPPVHSQSWRAGSGIYLDDRTNGWLPSGWYSIREHWNGYSGTINGRVWYLSDKVSQKTGVMRRGLFIHTEETPSRGQSSTIESQRWDGSSDYYSYGCIKISYGNIPYVHGAWTNIFTAHGSGSPYPMSSEVNVH